jgi:hypothetical protein
MEKEFDLIYFCCAAVSFRINGRIIGENTKTDRQAGRQIDRQTDRQVGRKAGRQTDKQVGKQVDRQTDEQVGKQAGR